MLYVMLLSDKQKIVFREEKQKMSPFDMCVMVFFISIAVKAFTDSLEFWREQDEAYLQAQKLEKQPVNTRAACRSCDKPDEASRADSGITYRVIPEGRRLSSDIPAHPSGAPSPERKVPEPEFQRAA